MIIETPEEFDSLVIAYLNECDKEKKRPTLTRMILYLGLSSRQSLDEYAKRSDFSDSVKRAKLFIEAEYEDRLHEQGCAGAIFALKNFGWKDEQHVSHGGAMGVLDGKSPAEYAKEVMDSLAEDLEEEGN